MIWLRGLELITSLLVLYGTHLITTGRGEGAWYGLAGQLTGLYCILWGGYFGWLPLDLAMGFIYGKACWRRLNGHCG